jgi:hypothetical protein
MKVTEPFSSNRRLLTEPFPNKGHLCRLHNSCSEQTVRIDYLWAEILIGTSRIQSKCTCPPYHNTHDYLELFVGSTSVNSVGTYTKYKTSKWIKIFETIIWRCTCPPHIQINLVLLILFYWVNLNISHFFILLFSVRVFRTMREIGIYEEYYIMWNFPLSYGRIVFWPWWTSPAVRGSGLVFREDSSQHLAPMCRDLAARNHTMQGQLTDRIGVFRHRSAALFKYANRIREFVSFMTSPRLQIWNGDAKRLRSL